MSEEKNNESGFWFVSPKAVCLKHTLFSPSLQYNTKVDYNPAAFTTLVVVYTMKQNPVEAVDHASWQVSQQFPAKMTRLLANHKLGNLQGSKQYKLHIHKSQISTMSLKDKYE